MAIATSLLILGHGGTNHVLISTALGFLHLSELVTGLVVARDSIVTHLLEQALLSGHGAIAPSRNSPLYLRPGRLNVVHYPGIDHFPVLQALNLGKEEILNFEG